MASCIALVFSKVVDPKNPLYLDDSYTGDAIDWEFGFSTQEKKVPASSCSIEMANDKVRTEPNKDFKGAADDINNNLKGRNKKLIEYKLVDPDEIIDPATLNNEGTDEDNDDDDPSENSETLSDSSLQPYDLSDDDADLKYKFSQLVDLVGALRKPDDPDGVSFLLSSFCHVLKRIKFEGEN